jgi:hypothetical protein
MDNQVLVGSAMESASLFVVDTKSWTAAPMKINGAVWHTSDLANGNLLASGNRKTTEPTELMRNKPVGADEASSRIHVFPNPVTDNQFIIRFGQLEAGSYTVQVTDVTGRQVLQQVVNVSGEYQSQKIKLAPSASRGVYLVKVLDANSKTTFSSKIVVQ